LASRGIDGFSSLTREAEDIVAISLFPACFLLPNKWEGRLADKHPAQDHISDPFFFEEKKKREESPQFSPPRWAERGEKKA
jgi:hypothetical protein